MSPKLPSSGERQRADGARKSSLPRLAPEFYRGHAYVHWTLTTEARATGWLSPAFHHVWQLALLHASTRYSLVCPTYVLMPDHMHLLWVGLSATHSDQRLAIEFLRKHLSRALAPTQWQKQAHDHVLRENDRAENAFRAVAHYILENPERAGLVESWSDYDYSGCCIPGYPAPNPKITGLLATFLESV